MPNATACVGVHARRDEDRSAGACLHRGSGRRDGQYGRSRRRRRRRRAPARSRCRARARRGARRWRATRSTHESRDRDPRPRCLARRSGVVGDPPSEPEPRNRSTRESRGSERTTCRRRNTGDRDDDQAGLHPAADVATRERHATRAAQAPRCRAGRAGRARARPRRSSRACAGSGGRRRSGCTSSQRPGSAMPPTDAAPPAAASVRTAGRSPRRKRCCQPHAFAA